MTRDELKEIIGRIIKKIRENEETPTLACIFNDVPECDTVTTYYAVGEED